MSKAWTATRLAQSAPPLTKQELEALNSKFKAYLFRRKSTGEVWATCCRKHTTPAAGRSRGASEGGAKTAAEASGFIESPHI